MSGREPRQSISRTRLTTLFFRRSWRVYQEYQVWGDWLSTPFRNNRIGPPRPRNFSLLEKVDLSNEIFLIARYYCMKDCEIDWYVVMQNLVAKNMGSFIFLMHLKIVIFNTEQNMNSTKYLSSRKAASNGSTGIYILRCEKRFPNNTWILSYLSLKMRYSVKEDNK